MAGDRRFPVPDLVRRRAEHEGSESLDWLANLDDTIASLEQDWGLTIGQALPGGSAAFVAEATDAEGKTYVIKLVTPLASAVRHEVTVLALARGKGYVHLLRHDEARHAILLERLADSLEVTDIPYQAKVDAICSTLLDAWMPVPAGIPLQTGAEKANSLGLFIMATFHSLRQPCSQAVIDRALMYCQDRAAAWRPENAVLAHGDPHPANTLAVPDAPGEYRLTDPEGLAIEPAYDLGVVLRAWHKGLAGPHVNDIARSHARHLTTRTQVPAESIWQWGYIERVSTGLHLMELGDLDQGRHYLRIADAIEAG